jgi:3-ketosteroid 9alpha-monooxygenase subunit A
VSRWPFTPFPDGWYGLCLADEVKPGAPRALHRLGRDLEVRCGADGAYAATAADGSVLPVALAGGVLFAWHHHDGAAADFSLPQIEEFDDPAWTPPQTHRFEVRSHLQEMGENAVDVAHFACVHKMGAPVLDRVRADGRLFVAETHGFATEDSAPYVPVGQRSSFVTTCFGPGASLVRFRSTVSTTLFATQTPLDGERCAMLWRTSVKRLEGDDATGLLERGYVDNLLRQVGEDIVIWEHKRYAAAPLLCDGDGEIALWRRWFSQFYPAGKEAAGGSAG